MKPFRSIILSSICFALYLNSNPLFSQNIAIIGTKNLTTSPSHQNTILTIKPSQPILKNIKLRLNYIQASHLNQNPQFNGDEQQLGMNNVPVLDQGLHGTCVTFAITAAIDAILNKGDYISQLCSLQLGTYLENIAFTPSGWEGSWANNILSQLTTYGYISTQTQKTQGCGGITEYPAYSPYSPSTGIDLISYHDLTELPLALSNIDYTALLDMNQRIYDDENTDQILNKIKLALDAGDRSTIGVILADINLGVAGAVGKYHVKNDSWILTQDILSDLKHNTATYGLHEMVVTGYNDSAMIKDYQNNIHYGLLTLRNSWGEDSGDNGDYYMSYDYFKTLIVEAYRIRKLPF